MPALDTPKMKLGPPISIGESQKPADENHSSAAPDPRLSPRPELGTKAGAEKTQHEESEERNLEDLARDIIASYDARIKIVDKIVNDTHAMLNQFRERRERMSRDLRKNLARHESLRKKDFDRMMAAIVHSQNEREREVRETLDAFRQGEAVIAKKINGLLERGEEVQMKDFKKTLNEIGQEQNGRMRETSTAITDQVQKMREEVHTMLDNFKTERQSVASAWHEMLGLFHTDKASKSKPATNPVRSKTPEASADISLGATDF